MSSDNKFDLKLGRLLCLAMLTTLMWLFDFRFLRLLV